MKIIKTIKDILYVIVSLFRPEKQENNIKVDVNMPVYICFSEEDKIKILNLLRPLIKDLNTDSSFLKLGQDLIANKVLKTFSTLSEDNKLLTINLTQNKMFNEQISKFVSQTVISKFQEKLNNELKEKFQVTSENGSILIRKLKS